jgi:hypothetical protein
MLDENIFENIEEIEETNQKNSCFYSSIVFITNSLIALYYNYLVYSLLFFILVITSLIVHSNINIYALVIDKIAIFAIAFYGGYLFFEKCKHITSTSQIILAIITLYTFLATIYLYYYGYMNNTYCYHEDRCIGNLYHSLLHLIASVGHIIIVIL